MPFQFGHFVQFWKLLVYNEGVLCNCHTSKSQLNVHSAQKPVFSFLCGLQQKSVMCFQMGPHTTRVPSGMTMVLRKNQRVLSPLYSQFLSGLPPPIYLYLLLKPVSCVKRLNNSSSSSVYSIVLFLSA